MSPRLRPSTARRRTEARRLAPELMRKRRSATISAGDPAVELFFEVHGPPPTLIVFGAGHLSMPLVTLAHDLGLKTIVVDGRPRFATRERFPDADELLIGIPSEIAETLSYNSSTFVVLTAHDYKYDLPVLKVVLPAGAAYVGLLGSKRRGDTGCSDSTRRSVSSGVSARNGGLPVTVS